MLPHPFTPFLNVLPLEDGTDVKVLCEFLLKVIKLCQVEQMTDCAIYDLTYPYCRGDLLTSVTHAITTGENFEDFHARSLGHFIPSREMLQLRIARYERVQWEGEHFSTYL